MVVAQQSAKPLAAVHLPFLRRSELRFEDLALQSLVVPFPPPNWLIFSASRYNPIFGHDGIRPTKIGANNWLFIGREDTGWRSAVIDTFIEQIRLHDLDPFAYLEWLFEKLRHDPPEDQYEALLPEAWIASRRDPAMQGPQQASA